MCGIIGYVGDKEACKPIIEGLKSLEYRGYDSSGIAILKDKKIQLAKKEGRIINLENYLDKNPLYGNLAIGHTRWATHGKPSDSNAHPFVSQGQRYAVVHNGIIENYLEIKEELSLQGVKFNSKTDSEVVAHLVEHLYKGDIKKAILEAAKRLKGSFALGIICVDDENTIYALKKDNPLIVGVNDNEGYICSDINSLQKFLTEVVVLENYQMAVVKKGALELYDFDGNSVEAVYTELAEEDLVSSENFECFMDKEIAEIPVALTRAFKSYKESKAFDAIDKDYLKSVKRIYIIGCGTALHAGMVGRKVIKRLIPDIDIYAEMASEFRYDDVIIDENTLTITISQSGETADTLSSLRMVKELGGKVITVCNVPSSSMVHYADYALLTNAGAEIAVASTKAYNCQNMILALFSIDFAYLRGNLTKVEYDTYMKELKLMSDKAKKTLILRNQVVKLSQANYRKKSVFYLGRGIDYFVALEGSLKLKEISYIHCEAYAAGELKHGTIALIEKDVLVIAVITQKDLIDKMYSSLVEVKTRGAKIMVITPFDDNKSLVEIADDIIAIPSTESIFYPMISVMPTQFLAYYIARAKGCDIDKPRNLAKSVTVE
jgi:glucosamine--fructose-6-phosphate aminotransferase (isomerizing)